MSSSSIGANRTVTTTPLPSITTTDGAPLRKSLFTKAAENPSSSIAQQRSHNSTSQETQQPSFAFPTFEEKSNSIPNSDASGKVPINKRQRRMSFFVDATPTSKTENSASSNAGVRLTPLSAETSSLLTQTKIPYSQNSIRERIIRTVASLPIPPINYGRFATTSLNPEETNSDSPVPSIADHSFVPIAKAVTTSGMKTIERPTPTRPNTTSTSISTSTSKQSVNGDS